jgi:hypothetical protein
MRGGTRKLVVRVLAGLGLAGAVTVLLASAARDSHAGAQAPRVLASFREPLIGFVQDGSWTASLQTPCGSLVTFRNLASGRHWTLSDNNAECSGEGSNGFFDGLALGGNRAVWSSGSCGNDCYSSLETAVAGGHAKTVNPHGVVTDGGDFAGETYMPGSGACGSGDWFESQAADEGIAVYSYANVEDGGGPTNCTFTGVAGGVYSVVPNAKIRGLPPAYALAVGDGLIADLPANYNTATQWFNSRPNQPVYVYDTRTRTKRTVHPSGDEGGLAVSSSELAVFAYSPVLAKSGAGHVIERFDSRTGAPLGSTPVPADTDPLSLAVSRNQIVYSTKRAIWLLDGVSGKNTLLATTTAGPIGLSIEGNRVYWAENLWRGRILTLTLP